MEHGHAGVPLSAEAEQKVRELERTLGNVYVIAYDQPVIPAALNRDQVSELERVERELGVFLVAYEKPSGSRSHAA